MKNFLRALLIAAICMPGLNHVEASAQTRRQQQYRPMTPEQEREAKRKADSLRRLKEVVNLIKNDNGKTLQQLKERGGSSRNLAEAYESIKSKMKEIEQKAPKDVTPEELYEILCEPLNKNYPEYPQKLNKYLNSLTTDEKSDLYTTAYLDWERKATKSSQSKAKFQKVAGKYIDNNAANDDNYYRRDYKQVRREVEQAKGAPLTPQEASALSASFSSAQRDVNVEHQARGPVNVLRRRFENCPDCRQVKAGAGGGSSSSGSEHGGTSASEGGSSSESGTLSGSEGAQ